MNESETNPVSNALDPKAQAKPVGPTPEMKSGQPTPESMAGTSLNLPPQLIKRVHEFYEDLGREEVLAVQEWEKAGHKSRENEKKAEPKPEVPAVIPDRNPTIVEPKPEAKKAGPELKAETKPIESKTDEKLPASKLETKEAAPKREYRNKIIFAISILGIVAALVAAYLFGRERKAQPPVFNPVSSPYASAIYANGIIESDQPSGANINIYPEVSGRSHKCSCVKASRCRQAPCC